MAGGLFFYIWYMAYSSVRKTNSASWGRAEVRRASAGGLQGVECARLT
jgi:hypothetical protein